MPHKQTQYSISFPNLSNDIRSQIWKENYKFRENCRVSHQSDHYWNFQINYEKCECDINNLEDPSSISINKLKHKRLVELYEKKKFEDDRPLSLNTLQINSHQKNNEYNSKEKHLQISPYENKDNTELIKDSNILGKSKIFVPFGWNDTNKDIGKKKTFNIKAPEKEVYPNVIFKSKQNRKTNDLPKLANKKIQKRSQKPSIWEFNNDIIWTTEYREKFSKNHSEKVALSNR